MPKYCILDSTVQYSTAPLVGLGWLKQACRDFQLGGAVTPVQMAAAALKVHLAQFQLVPVHVHDWLRYSSVRSKG